jgi:hypothetical protein
MYTIKFENDSKVRYLIQTQGHPHYNCIDSGRLNGARTWKTKRGADKYLVKLLAELGAERLCRRWKAITVVEVV